MKLTEREEMCLDALNKSGQPDRVLNHCRSIAALSAALGNALAEKGIPLDLSLCWRGGLLHDVCRTRRRHAETGKAYLEELGLTDEARICELHSGEDIDPDIIDEAAVVCLADKLVSGGEYVGVEERFRYTRERFAHDTELLKLIDRRHAVARALYERVQTIIDAPPESVLKTADKFDKLRLV